MSAVLPDSLDRCAELGMELAFHARRAPDKMALLDGDLALSFAQLNGLANQAARLMRSHGLVAGDAVAIIATNSYTFIALYWGCHRAGLRLTPVNWQLGLDELRYVVENCEARLCFVDTAAGAQALELAADMQRRGALGCYVFGEGAGGAGTALEPALAAHSASDIDEPLRGDVMLYTSGTTGRPKGVWRPQLEPQLAVVMQNAINAAFDFRGDGDIALATGPLYHSGPLNLCMAAPLASGVPVVLMRRWDAEAMLALVARHQITHTFCVPTMFHRLLRLPAATRQAHSLSSLRCVVHGAAPCPVETKRAMLDWLGPILLEMFASTEGFGTWITSEEWLRYPGSVGRPAPGQILVLDERRGVLATNTPGTLHVKMPGGAFRYFGEPDKTGRAQHDGYFTVGDIGYLNDEGYLFLSGRDAEVIIAGGVNIYPQEIDDVLMQHPDVADVACVGVPNAEWGEEVRAVVQLREGRAASPALAEELIAFCRARMAAQKCPRAVDVVAALPRSAAGKALRGQLRERYWPSDAGGRSR